jgi:hypothetical protein
MRWEEKCVTRCPKNYEKKMNEESEEYTCVPKTCKDRIPFINGSCLVKEDISLKNEKNIFGCYFLRENNNIKNDNDRGRCVVAEDCPSDYPGV